MSSSIRPPGSSSPGPSGIDSPLAPDQARSGAGVGEASSPAAPQVTAGTQAGSAAAGQAAVASPTSQWISRLEAGEISRSEAIEGIVAQAVEQHGGARLSPVLRSELENVLRAALIGDPVLGRLLGET